MLNIISRTYTAGLQIYPFPINLQKNNFGAFIMYEHACMQQNIFTQNAYSPIVHMTQDHTRRIRQKRRQRSSQLLNHCRTIYFPLGSFEEKDEQNDGYLRNGCFGKMDDHPVHTKPPPYQDGYSSKKVVHIILAAKWLVRHSSTSPNQQRRHLPSLLSLSYAVLLCSELQYLQSQEIN